MKLWTYQLELVPDSVIPQFRRLQYRRQDVSLQDVFIRGIHPHAAVMANGGYDNTRAREEIQVRLNAEDAAVPALKAHSVTWEIEIEPRVCGSSCDPLETLLQQLAKSVYFVDDLGYEQLVEIAIDRLRKTWNHEVASNMVRAVGRDFAGIRDLLKKKDARIVLAGFHSLNELDLSRVVSVEDFLTEEKLLIQSGIGRQNFRRAGALAKLTDDCGLLRFTPAITHCVVATRQETEHWTPFLTYRCTVEGDRVRCVPNLKPDPLQRAKAKLLAQDLGKKQGLYCFTCSINELEAATEDWHLRICFPELRYGEAKEAAAATANVKPDAVACYGETLRLLANSSNDDLRSALHKFGRPMSGKKDDLLRRLVELLAEQYAAVEEQMNAFFARYRFIRIGIEGSRVKSFPVLADHKLRELLLAMYCLRHMRGNVILEASHVNESVKLVDLAEAILCGRVRLAGSFVPAV